MKIRRLAWVAIAMLALGGCRSAGDPESAPGAAEPGAAVERFLELANQKRFGEMARVFGTRSGPFAGQTDARTAELRMFLFSCVLRHTARSVLNEQPVPGSVGGAVRFDVRLTQGSVQNVVPIRVVRGGDDRWYVEDVRLDVITGSQAAPPAECRQSTQL